MKNIGIIIVSVRDGRIGESVAKHVLELTAASKNVKYELIDLKKINLPLLNEPYPAAQNKYQYAHTKVWSSIINGYDGFIIVTPEYNHGYPATIKNALDYLYVEWHNKPLALIGYGYDANGARAIEQLRPILGTLRLKVLWKNVVISLANNIKDGIFQPSEVVNTQLLDIIAEFEKNL